VTWLVRKKRFMLGANVSGLGLADGSNIDVGDLAVTQKAVEAVGNIWCDQRAGRDRPLEGGRECAPLFTASLDVVRCGFSSTVTGIDAHDEFRLRKRFLTVLSGPFILLGATSSGRPQLHDHRFGLHDRGFLDPSGVVEGGPQASLDQGPCVVASFAGSRSTTGARV